MTKRKPPLPSSGKKRKPKREQLPWCRASPLMSGVKDKPLIEKGGIKLVEAALNVWAAKNDINFSGQWRGKKPIPPAK